MQESTTSISLTKELVSFPSVRGAEHTAQDFVAAQMRRRGLTVDRFQLQMEDIHGLVLLRRL